MANTTFKKGVKTGLGVGIGIGASVIFIAVFLLSLLSIAIPVLTLIYVYKLENPECKCTVDWRNTFIKYWTVLSILLAFLNGSVIRSPILAFILVIMNAINVYALFTYVGDINAQQCKCATENMRYINDILYYWRYVMVIGVVISLIGSISLLVSSSSI